MWWRWSSFFPVLLLTLRLPYVWFFQPIPPVPRDFTFELYSAVTNESVHQIDIAYRSRMIDCSDESRHYGSEPLVAYPFMKFFSGEIDPFNGFYYREDYPLYVHIQGISQYNEDSPIFIGLRGDTAGVHRSLLTPQVHAVYKEQPDGVMFMPGSYVQFENGVFQSVCHRRDYPGIGYIGSDWPALKGNPWHPITKFFKDHGNLYIFSYSNGGVVKDNLLRTSGKYLGYPDLRHASKFLKEYSEQNAFIYPKEVSRITAFIDIETNYSRRDIWNQLKFIRERVIGEPSATYYAATTVEGVMALNHVFMVRALELSGRELDNGVIRYENSLGNVTIDFVAKSEVYHQNVNLNWQAPFTKNNKVRSRLDTGHYKIVAYAVKTFHGLVRKRGVLL